MSFIQVFSYTILIITSTHFSKLRPESKYMVIFKPPAASINIKITDCFYIDPLSLYPVQPSCYGSSDGNIVFDESGIIGGTGPFTFDWDLVSTPGNDVFSDDGLNYIDSIPAGEYAIIVTDALGCSGSATVVVEDAPQILITSVVDSTHCPTLIGSINITSVSGPPGTIIYDWDFAGTPANDDYGAPPATSDPQDISGLSPGTYFLKITITDDPVFPNYSCMFSDTFRLKWTNIWTGKADSAWENPTNWNCQIIPDNNTDVIIPTSSINFPVVNSNGNCRSIFIAQNATLTITTGFQLDALGDN